MGEISSAKNHGILTTVGLGSCIGVTLYDHKVKVGVMGHIFLRAADPMTKGRRRANTPILVFPP